MIVVAVVVGGIVELFAGNDNRLAPHLGSSMVSWGKFCGTICFLRSRYRKLN